MYATTTTVYQPPPPTVVRTTVTTTTTRAAAFAVLPQILCRKLIDLFSCRPTLVYQQPAVVTVKGKFKGKKWKY